MRLVLQETIRATVTGLGVVCFLATARINAAHAVLLWGALGGYLSIVSVPIMLVAAPVVPVADSRIPLSWLLIARELRTVLSRPR